MIGAAATRNRAAETLGLVWILAALALGGVNQPTHAGQQFQFDTPANLFESGVTKDVAITDDDAAEDPETFEVTLSNPQGDGDFPEPTLVSPDTATVTINNPNEAPDVTDAGLTTDEDTQGSVTLSASDPDGDSLDFSVTSAPANGTASVDGSGTATYTPDPDFNGSDSFIVEVTDGNGGSDTASVSVTVNAVNDAPSVTDASLATDEDKQGSVTLSASDPDGDSLSFSVTSAPSNGSASVGNSGTATYMPDGGFTGSDSFTVKVSDGNGGRAIASVDVTVNATSGDGGGSYGGGGALGYLVMIMGLLAGPAVYRRRLM